MHKSISLIILSSSLFTACDEAKQTQHGDENGRLHIEYSMDFNDFNSIEKLKVAQIRSVKLVTAMVEDYNLDTRSKDELLHLTQNFQCMPMGVMVGQLKSEVTENGSYGEWKINSFYSLDEIVSQDYGEFEINKYGEGFLYSIEGDSLMEAILKGDADNFEMVGMWKTKEGHGEIVGIKQLAEREDIFGLWTSCE